MPENLTHLSLFSGIGGIDLAAEWAGFETVGQCEFADYPTKVLEKHWPTVPRWRDIRDVTAGSFRRKTGLHTATIISGGFPCQPFSVAGSRKGKTDDRYLWPEMLRVIKEVNPSWVLVENVPGILSIAADDICKDLEREGYEVWIFDFEAAAVGAPHRRERIFFVGNAKHHGSPSCEIGRVHIENAGEVSKREKSAVKLAGASRSRNDEIMAHSPGKRCGEAREHCDRSTERIALSRENVADTQSILPQAGFCSNGKRDAGFADNRIICNAERCGRSRDTRRRSGQEPSDGCWWAVEPELGRVANGISARVDRLRCLGNAVVPQQVYPILKAIALIESEVAP